MTGRVLAFAMVGAVIAAVLAVVVMRLFALGGNAMVAGAVAGGVAGALIGRAAAR